MSKWREHPTIGVKLTFPVVDLEGHEMGVDVIVCQLQQRLQQLRSLLQRLGRLRADQDQLIRRGAGSRPLSDSDLVVSREESDAIL